MDYNYYLPFYGYSGGRMPSSADPTSAMLGDATGYGVDNYSYNSPYNSALMGNQLKQELKNVGVNTLKNTAAGLALGLGAGDIIASSLNPLGLASSFGNVIASGMGVDVNQKSNAALMGLTSFLGPAGTIIGGIAAPYVTDAIADAFDVVVATNLAFVKRSDVMKRCLSSVGTSASVIVDIAF